MKVLTPQECLLNILKGVCVIFKKMKNCCLLSFKMNKNLVENTSIVDYGKTKEKDMYQIVFDLIVDLEWENQLKSIDEILD